MRRHACLFAVAVVMSLISAQGAFADGDFVWARNLGGGGGGSGAGLSIDVDSAGNVYTTGDADVGIFVSKLDSGGDLVWAKSMGGTGDDRGNSIAVDSAGNVYITGWFWGTADFDPGPGTYNLTSAGERDIFVSKLDSSGNFVWAKRMGCSESSSGSWDHGYGIAVDSQGNVYTTGSFNGAADFDPGPGTYTLTSAGEQDIFVSKLDSGGNFVWAKRVGASLWDDGFDIAVDSAGNVYATGSFYGTVDFDPGPGTYNLTSAEDYDTFVSKLDSGGNFVWAKRLGGTGRLEVGGAIAVDSSRNVYTTGHFRGTADFDPGPGTYNLTSAGEEDIFVSKLDRRGNFVWAKSVGGIYEDGGSGIAVDSVGNTYTTGSFQGTADFDPGAGTYNLTSAGWSDIFILRLGLPVDTDGDGLPDDVETDTGVYVDEMDTGTDPNDPDSDDDQMPDGWEVDNGLDPNDSAGDNGADGDPDGDDYINLEEYLGGTDPQDDSSVPPALAAYRTVIDGIKVTYTKLTCLARRDELSNALVISVWGDEPGVLKVIAQEDAPLYWNDRCDVVIDAPDAYIKKVIAKGIRDLLDLYVCGQAGYVKKFILKDGYVGSTLHYGEEFGLGSDALDIPKKVLIKRGATTAPVLGVPYPNTSFNPARQQDVLTTIQLPIEPERKPLGLPLDYEDDDVDDEDIKLAELEFAEVEARVETKAAYVTEVDGVKVRYSLAGCVAYYNDDDGTLTIEITDSDGDLLVKCGEEAYLVWGDYCDVYIDAPDASVNATILKGNLDTQLHVVGSVGYIGNFKLKYGCVGDTDFYDEDFGLGCMSLTPPNKILLKWGWTTAPALGVSY